AAPCCHTLVLRRSSDSVSTRPPSGPHRLRTFASSLARRRWYSRRADAPAVLNEAWMRPGLSIVGAESAAPSEDDGHTRQRTVRVAGSYTASVPAGNSVSQSRHLPA